MTTPFPSVGDLRALLQHEATTSKDPYWVGMARGILDRLQMPDDASLVDAHLALQRRQDAEQMIDPMGTQTLLSIIQSLCCSADGPHLANRLIHALQSRHASIAGIARAWIATHHQEMETDDLVGLMASGPMDVVQMVTEELARRGSPP